MRRTDGWDRKVLKMPVCQQEKTPRRKPGRNCVAKIVASTKILWVVLKPFSPISGEASGEASASPFPTSARRQATKMSRNLGDKHMKHCQRHYGPRR